MYKKIILAACLAFVSSCVAGKGLRPVEDRNTLCSLEFGKYADGVYVGSTPMEDACRTEHYDSRKKICANNYEREEVINACVHTYDAITEILRRAKNKR